MKHIGPHPPDEMYDTGLELDVGWHQCGSGDEWCQANPLPGREDVKRGELEWFTVEERA